MDCNLKTLFLKVKDFDPLALTSYQYYLSQNSTNQILLSLSDLFNIMECNFEKILEDELLKNLLFIFHYTVQKSSIDNEILLKAAESLNNMSQKYSNSENFQNLIFEVLHQFLTSILKFHRDYSKDIATFDVINVCSENKIIRQRSRICLELLVKIYPNSDILLNVIEYNHIYFGEFFTHFVSYLLKEKHLYKNKSFWLICLTNLVNENRKFAIYWLKVAIKDIDLTHPDDFEIPNFFKWSLSESDKIISSWYLFLTILESLDGKQSHLILPSLGNLKNINIFGIWHEFIICEVMKHTNTLVLKWAANFVLSRHTCDDFNCADEYLDCCKSISIIIQGFNNTFLYYGANCLKSSDFIKFISKNRKKFFIGFVEINWKPIPLFVVMQAFKIISIDNSVIDTTEIKDSAQSKEESNKILVDIVHLLKLAGKIRKIENKIIRTSIRKIFFETFRVEIDALEVRNFFKLMEFLFNDNEEKSETYAIIVENKIKKINIKTFSISFGLLKTLLEVHINFSECVLSKIYNDILLNCCLNDLLRVIPLAGSYKHNLIQHIEYELKHYDENNDTKFLRMFLQLSGPLAHKPVIEEAYSLIINDFKEIGRSGLKNDFNFCILKQTFVDLFATHIFEESEQKLNQFDLLKNTSVAEYPTFVKCINSNLDIEMLLNKGSFETINQFLKRKHLMKTILCFDIETMEKHFNLELYKMISHEILINSKKYGFQYVREAVIKLIEFIMPEYPNIVNFVLDIDQSSNEYFNVVYLTAKEKLTDFNSTIKNFYCSENGFDFLLKGLLYGEPLLGEARIEHEFLIKIGSAKSLASSSKIRHLAIELTQYLICNVYDSHILSFIRDKLLTESENLNSKKSRYFKNSKQHKIKLRIIQALAIISLNSDLEKKAWNDRYLKLIFEENNQIDVTYIVELLIAKTIPFSKLLQLLENISDLNNAGIISLFAIIFMVCYNFIEKNNNDLVKRIVKLILPWTMGQNFHIRLYAQITIYHLVKNFKLEDYYYLSDSILESLKQGTAEKNYKKLNYDFRFQEPILEELLKLHVICYAIPRLNRTDIDEWYNEEFHDKYSNLFNKFYEEETFETREELIVNNIENVQRKINPISLEENCNLFLENCVENKKEDKEIVVLASLVDKLPNLGGIARTCEVLGINKLSISSLKYVEAKEFKGLSMTAEKWLNIFELKPSDIQNYIIQMKSYGYEIIGAEQTANSENFINFKFPKKTVLLLGHEKEGIPANLISFLDYAVEIPQFGMIRSLNVHVTGALFMWEYCKQHIAANK